MHAVNTLLLAALASSAAALNRFDPSKLTFAAANAERRAAKTTSTVTAAAVTTADTTSADTDPFSYASVSDSRTTDPAYTSSCESKLFSSLYSAIPSPTDEAVFSLLQASQGICLQSIPAKETSALAAYEATVSAWFSPISSAYYSLFSDCPYLEDYKFTEINGVFVPAECTVYSDVGFVSSATTTGSAGATKTASAAATGGVTTTSGASATASATTSATGTAAGTTASGNGSPRATGIGRAAVAVVGVLGAVAAL